MIDLNTKNEILNALSNLKTELDESRQVVLKYALEDDYKEGYKKAMTNVMAILSERMRIIQQDGDPTIRVKEIKQFYKVPVKDLSNTLDRLQEDGFLWKDGSEIKTYYHSAIDRDYGTMIPVLDIELSVGKDTGKVYRFVSLTTDRLLLINKNERPVLDLSDLMVALGWGVRTILFR